MPTTKICIVVDHPDRDLAGATLVADHLTRRNVLVYLVPIYRQWEVLLLNPDAVIINYVRFNNIAFIRACRELGCAIVLSDTEGMAIKLLAAQANEINAEIDHWCLWGNAQYQAIASQLSDDPRKLVVTGCPRFDFLASKWRKAIPRTDRSLRTQVLVNTLFSLSRPRFQNLTKQHQEIQRVYGMTSNEVDELLAESELARTAMMDAVEKSAAKFEDIDFIIRPHPFEDVSSYRDAFDAIPNIRIEADGNVHEILMSCDVLLHYYCTTALEAAIIGKPAICLKTVATPIFSSRQVPLSAEVSLSAHCLNDLWDLLEELRKDGAVSAGADLTAKRAQIIREYFRSDDGESSFRVATVVSDAADRAFKVRQSIQNPPTASHRFLLAMKIGSKFGGRFGGLKFFALCSLGSPLYYGLKKAFLRQSKSEQKLFAADEVGGILKSVSSQSEVIRKPEMDDTGIARLITPFLKLESLCVKSLRH